MSPDSSSTPPIPPDLAQNEDAGAQTPPLNRRNRPSRACTLRAAQRLCEQKQRQQAASERRQKPSKKEPEQPQEEEQEDDEPSSPQHCSGGSTKIITPLVVPPEPSQLPRWNLRSMWELASVLNFLHVFRSLLNINAEFSVEEFETALLTPNDTLGDIHMPLLKAIPPITRMALTRDTWITVLCRKLRDWWHWVADGELPIVASHGLEIEAYKSLDPGIRVVILKALCDIRVEQEDIRNYIDNALKHGVQLSAFRKERVGGDSHGINYWYEDDPLIGYRLYREIRKVERKNGKIKGSHVLPCTTYQWETVATNFEEFQDVSEKLFNSKSRTEMSLGKKLKNNMLPEIEREHKRKEKLLKKQHREALLLDNYLTVDGFGRGRSLRDRKPVTYTFDDYDRSINEAIKTTKKKPPSPEFTRTGEFTQSEPAMNGKSNGPQVSELDDYESASASASPRSPQYDEVDDKPEEPLDRSNRRRQRPQRYSEKEFVQAVSDTEAGFDTDDDIVGEAVYDEDYLRKRKRRKQTSSSSEGDEEYHWDGEENAEDEEEEDDSPSMSEDSDVPQKFKKLRGRTRRQTKLKSVDELQPGLRRSKRATRTRIDYKKYEFSESDPESKHEKPNASKRATRTRIDYKKYEFSESDTESKHEEPNGSDEQSDMSGNEEFFGESQDSDGSDEDREMKVEQSGGDYTEMEDEKPSQLPDKSESPSQDEGEGGQKMRFLDLNELAPGSGFDDGPSASEK